MGEGNSYGFVLVVTGLMPFCETMCPVKPNSVPNSSFFLDIVMLCSLHLLRIILVLSISSSSVSAHIRMSSTSLRVHGRPSMTMSDLLHHSSDDAFSPIGALVYLNFPCGNRNVVSFELSSSNASWKYPCTASNFAKYLAVTGIACSISLVDVLEMQQKRPHLQRMQNR